MIQIPGNDSNAAYDVIPSQDWLHGWWTVTYRDDGGCLEL